MYFNFIVFIYSCEFVKNIFIIFNKFQQLEGTYSLICFSCLCYLLNFLYSCFYICSSKCVIFCDLFLEFLITAYSAYSRSSFIYLFHVIAFIIRFHFVYCRYVSRSNRCNRSDCSI